MKTSPLAPASFPALPEVAGLRLATTAAQISNSASYHGRSNLMLATLCAGTTVAGVFTRSATRSAAVLDCQSKIGGPPVGPAAILVNAGNANAFTGGKGTASVARLCTGVADTLGISAARVFTASTGVIGEALPDEQITAKLADLKAGLSPSELPAAARAIRTTDTFAKGASATPMVNGHKITISGIAKGSGMIAPDMATMLVYIFTDAAYEQAALQALAKATVDRTFNCITVDSDTSTSDTLLLAATGASGVDATGNAAFSDALHAVMLDLAHQVVRDGEGATKFIEVRVTGAQNDEDARKVAGSIANSPLVKTAIAGEDPNWGRVVMAIGKAGAQADRDLIKIHFGDILVAENGWVAPGYSEDAGAAYMQRQYIDIAVDLGLDNGQATFWTCDLTHGYITINADYRS